MSEPIETQYDDRVEQTDNGWHEGDPTEEVSQDPNMIYGSTVEDY